MKLRTRLAVTLGIATVSVLAVLGWAQSRFHSRVRLDAVAESTIDRMESGGRDRCETNPTRWPGGRFGPGGLRRDRGLGPRGPGRAFDRRVFAYDVDFKSLNDKSPPFPPKLAAELRSGAEVASARMSGRRRIHIAVRMPWSDGPCAVLLLQTKGPPPWLSFAVLLPAALVTLVVILVSLIVAGPLVARVRRLTEAVDGNLPIVEDGNDEITDLGRAFQRNRKTIEAQVQSLTEREAALRNYIANTSHDVMLPLSVLQGHLVALQQQLESGASLGPTAIVPSIEEAQYLGSLLHNLNAAARLQADPGLVHRESIDLNRLVARVAERHRPIAKRRGIDLEYAVPDMPVTFAGDVTLLEQGLGNIVQNAVRYNERGGHVAITLDERPSNWVIRVIDDGPGIPRADRDRVLEPSFRGSQARTRHPHGMGLGLHIAADVASRHGLRLTLDETPGGGLTVTLAPTNRSEPDT